MTSLVQAVKKPSRLIARLSRAFLRRCEELNLTRNEVVGAIEKAASIDPLLREEFEKVLHWGHTAFRLGGMAVGGTVGALAGAIPGLAGGPLAVPAGLAGGAVGGELGTMGGNWLGKKILGEEEEEKAPETQGSPVVDLKTAAWVDSAPSWTPVGLARDAVTHLRNNSPSWTPTGMLANAGLLGKKADVQAMASEIVWPAVLTPTEKIAASLAILRQKQAQQPDYTRGGSQYSGQGWAQPIRPQAPSTGQPTPPQPAAPALPQTIIPAPGTQAQPLQQPQQSIMAAPGSQPPQAAPAMPMSVGPTSSPTGGIDLGAAKASTRTSPTGGNDLGAAKASMKTSAVLIPDGDWPRQVGSTSGMPTAMEVQPPVQPPPIPPPPAPPPGPAKVANLRIRPLFDVAELQKEAILGAVGRGLMTGGRWLGSKSLAGAKGVVSKVRGAPAASAIPEQFQAMARGTPAPGRIARVLENPMAQMGLFMGAQPAIEGVGSLLSGPDPQQQAAKASQNVGMRLAQAASLNDPAGISSITGSQGQHPAISQALTSMWSNPQTRQMFSNQDVASNAVYQMHQHLKLNPQLTGDQLATVVGNQMGKTAEWVNLAYLKRAVEEVKGSQLGNAGAFLGAAALGVLPLSMAGRHMVTHLGMSDRGTCSIKDALWSVRRRPECSRWAGSAGQCCWKRSRSDRVWARSSDWDCDEHSSPSGRSSRWPYSWSSAHAAGQTGFW